MKTKNAKIEYKRIKEAVMYLKKAEKLLLKTNIGLPRCDLIDTRQTLEEIVTKNQEQ